MNILVIVGYCLKVNSSANLCHISYINGLLSSGHSVELLTASDKGCVIDNSIELPAVNNIYEYDCSLYEMLNKKKNNLKKNKENDSLGFTINFSQNTSTLSIMLLSKIISNLKKIVRKLYGKYGTDIAWYTRAKKFSSTKKYDCVISLTFPPTSHLLAMYLKKHKKVIADRWIQIWEDPWYTDLFGLHNVNKNTIKKEENKLLTNAQDIVYVSPITLKYQQRLFPENASKMRWEPLPTYYVSKNNNIDFSKLSFGYFGDYNSNVRNLEPFYNVAKDNHFDFTVCGATNLNLASTETVSIYPRMPLSELSIHENKANVLVFLSNLKGGQIPGKIYQYSATNKFILFILDGTEDEKKILKDYFSKLNRYVFCDNNEKSILEAINYIKNSTNKTELFTPIDNFEPKKIINKILES